MSKKTAQCCDYCEKHTFDYYKEIGWIHICENAITITGGRKPDGTANTVRFIQAIKVKTEYDTMDFCSLECLINYLYFKESLFNGKYKTYEDFLIKQPRAVQELFKHIKSKFGRDNASNKRKHG